jgi:outer membrane protein OmpA-like peptidoglycan-associated protein
MKHLAKTTLFFLFLFFFQNLAFGQKTFVLKGKIIDGAYDEPLMAAAVSIKGKAVGTATDINGKFSLEIKKDYWNDTLVVSMLGYTAQKISVQEAFKLPNYYFEMTLAETSFNLEMAEIGAPIILNNIFFNFNKHELLSTSYTELEKLYNFLKKNQGVIIEIAGHTDSIGTEIYNEALSEARASSVMAYLEEKGIEQGRMTAKGYGESRPVVPNNTEVGQAMNRRVEFTVLSKGEIVNESQMPTTTPSKPVLATVVNKDKTGKIVLVPPTEGSEIEIESEIQPQIKPEIKLEVPKIENPKIETTTPTTITKPTVENKPKPTVVIDRTTKVGKIQGIANDYAEKSGFNGAILVYHEGKTLYSDGVGFANLSNIKPNTLKTKFYLGSMSEEFTAALILKAVKANKLKLSLPINTYLSGLPKHIGDKVTIMQLLSHTSGLCESNVANLAELDLCFLPNGAKNYSTVNYILLGKILETIYKDNYNNLITKQIFSPLGMTNTKVITPLFKDENLAKGYRKEGGKTIAIEPQSAYNEAAANGIVTTIEDLAKWQKALKDNNWLSPDLQILMETPTQGNQTLIGDIQQVVLGTKVLKVLLTETSINGHKAFVIKTLTGNSMVIITSNVETVDLQSLYRDVLKVLFIE